MNNWRNIMIEETEKRDRDLEQMKNSFIALEQELKRLPGNLRDHFAYADYGYSNGSAAWCEPGLDIYQFTRQAQELSEYLGPFVELGESRNADVPSFMIWWNIYPNTGGVATIQYRADSAKCALDPFAVGVPASPEIRRPLHPDCIDALKMLRESVEEKGDTECQE